MDQEEVPVATGVVSPVVAEEVVSAVLAAAVLAAAEPAAAGKHYRKHSLSLIPQVFSTI